MPISLFSPPHYKNPHHTFLNHVVVLDLHCPTSPSITCFTHFHSPASLEYSAKLAVLSKRPIRIYSDSPYDCALSLSLQWPPTFVMYVVSVVMEHPAPFLLPPMSLLPYFVSLLHSSLHIHPNCCIHHFLNHTDCLTTYTIIWYTESQN